MEMIGQGLVCRHRRFHQQLNSHQHVDINQLGADLNIINAE